MRITVEEAVLLLEAGEVVAIPTDTVYGVAADMNNPAAIQKIFALKGRPETNPLPILAADIEQVLPFVSEEPPGFRELVAAFWPGPLTIVVPVEVDKILEEVRAGLSTVGFRVPEHPLTLQLLEQFGPAAVTSANLSGMPAPARPEEIEKTFGEDFPVLDGGECPHGLASTVVAYKEGAWTILRQGSLSAEELVKPLDH